MKKIQSLSVVVPVSGCINSCEFCVSRMHSISGYENRVAFLDTNQRIRDEYSKRLEFARDNNCNTVMITGVAEPQQDKVFLKRFFNINAALPSPFKNIEMQTTGALITKKDIDWFAELGLSTISLSVSSFTDKINNNIINQGRWDIDLKELCRWIKDAGINLRLSINLTDQLLGLAVENDKVVPAPDPSLKFILEAAHDHYEADQVTLREMYGGSNPTNLPQEKWVRNHKLSSDVIKEFRKYLEENGKHIDNLEYGQKRYSINGLSVVLDDDCMAKNAPSDSYKYLILRPNCKLYSQWDDPGSLIF